MTLRLTRRQFSVSEYHQMVVAGILSEDDRVELIEGEIIEMAPIGSPHAACVDRLNRFFTQNLGGTAQVRVQNPVRLSERSEPQPDLSLLRPRADFYASAHPTPLDVRLLVEVADSSFEFDRQVKVPLYARAAIPELWLVILGQSTVTVHRDPTPAGYQTVFGRGRGDQLAPLAFPDCEIGVSAILGESQP